MIPTASVRKPLGPASPPRPRWDLGARLLWPKWRAMFSSDGLRHDLVAGVSVAFVALPLSLAIALASGVDPAVALMTSIVAGVLCALFAGTELAVSGPAAALSALTGTILLDFGLNGLLFVGLVVGLLQVLTGVFRLGRLVHYVPLAVVHGFTAGMGVIIMVAQVPRALGLPAPDQHHVFDVIDHLYDYVIHTDGASFSVALLSIVVMWGFGRLAPRAPGLLFAVAIPSVLAWWLKLDVAPLGAIPRHLPQPSLPLWPTGHALELAADAFAMYAIASLETLLSSAAIDKMTPEDRSDHDQEMIGQGLGNVIVATLGGIVVSGVIMRSALNVSTGARTRRAAIIHALLLLASVYFLAPLVERIPVAVLAGVLLALGARMVGTAPLRSLWRISRIDGLVMVLTTVAIVGLGLAAGVQYGIVAALVIAAIGLGRPSTDVHQDEDDDDVRHISVAGPLTFLAAPQLERLRESIDQIKPGSGVVMNLSGVTSIDASGAECIVDLLRSVHLHSGKIALLGLRAKPRAVLIAADPSIDAYIVAQLTDAERLLGRADIAHSSRLVLGVRRFHRELRSRYEPLLRELGTGQSPHTLFITCADSRINPNLLTGTDPGELFIMRNIGNLVPHHNDADFITEAAGIEYAIGVLGTQQIVVCGHSACGAVKALLGGAVPPELAHIADWKQHAAKVFGGHAHPDAPDDAARANVRAQLEHLRQYPIVKQRIAAGQLRLDGWFYDVRTGTVSAWDEETSAFKVVGSDPSSEADDTSTSKPVQIDAAQ